MICECCKAEVGARRPFMLDNKGSGSILACESCFPELMEVSRAIRDASGWIARSIVSQADIAPIPVGIFEAPAELRMEIVDSEVMG